MSGAVWGTSGHSLQALLRLRSEETETRAEQVLGTAVTRTRLLGGHLAIAVASPPILMTVVGLCAGGAYVRISPFANVPNLPGGQLEIMPLAVLCLVAIASTAAGIWGFRRRDIG